MYGTPFCNRHPSFLPSFFPGFSGLGTLGRRAGGRGDVAVPFGCGTDCRLSVRTTWQPPPSIRVASPHSSLIWSTFWTDVRLEHERLGWPRDGDTEAFSMSGSPLQFWHPSYLWHWLTWSISYFRWCMYDVLGFVWCRLHIITWLCLECSRRHLELNFGLMNFFHQSLLWW